MRRTTVLLLGFFVWFARSDPYSRSICWIPCCLLWAISHCCSKKIASTSHMSNQLCFHAKRQSNTLQIQIRFVHQWIRSFIHCYTMWRLFYRIVEYEARTPELHLSHYFAKLDTVMIFHIPFFWWIVSGLGQPQSWLRDNIESFARVRKWTPWWRYHGNS